MANGERRRGETEWRKAGRLDRERGAVTTKWLRLRRDKRGQAGQVEVPCTCTHLQWRMIHQPSQPIVHFCQSVPEGSRNTCPVRLMSVARTQPHPEANYLDTQMGAVFEVSAIFACTQLSGKLVCTRDNWPSSLPTECPSRWVRPCRP